MQKTPKEILQSRKVMLPKPFAYECMRMVYRLDGLFCNASFHFHFNQEELNGKQIIFLADHASRISYSYSLAGFKGFRFNILVSYQNLFHRLLFQLECDLGIIPKRTFVTDIKSVRDMLRVLKLGGNIAVFPEGVQSCAGSESEINKAIASFLKRAQLPVVLCKSYGAYLSYPRYNRKRRLGKQEYHYYVLFTPEELKNLDAGRVYDKLVESIKYNDFEWNRKHLYKYRMRNPLDHLADGITGVLYRCPCCHREFELYTSGNHILCRNCGNDIVLDNTYMFQKSSEKTVLPYADLDDWVADQKTAVLSEVRNPEFYEEYECIVRSVHDDKLSFRPFYVCGEGCARIDKEGFHYTGTYKGRGVDLFIGIEELPAVYFDSGHSNDLFYKDEFYCFYPKELPDRVSKFSFEIEALHMLAKEKDSLL